MGICASCFKGAFEPRKVSSHVSAGTAIIDAETRRQRQAEAAEKRFQEQEHRGIKNIENVRRMQKKSEQADAADFTPNAGLKWQVS